MNIQSMMKQAQQLQKDMLNAKEELNRKTFETEKNFIKIKMSGEKKLLEFKINQEKLDEEDIEILEDLVVVAVNETIDKIEKETEKEMGKYTKGLPGLF
jgi:nucleoid-associated protein EbfC